MTTKSSGFTLIELMVVIAILGILSATATVMYSSYTQSAKKTAAKNIMLQISLGQTEYLSSYGTNYYNESGGGDISGETRLMGSWIGNKVSMIGDYNNLWDSVVY